MRKRGQIWEDLDGGARWEPMVTELVWIDARWWHHPESSFLGKSISPVPKWNIVKGRLRIWNDEAHTHALCQQRVTITTTTGTRHGTVLRQCLLQGDTDTLPVQWQVKFEDGTTETLSDATTQAGWVKAHPPRQKPTEQIYWPALVVAVTNRFGSGSRPNELVLLCPEQDITRNDPVLHVMAQQDAARYLRPAGDENPLVRNALRYYEHTAQQLGLLERECAFCSLSWDSNIMSPCASLHVNCGAWAHQHCITADSANPDIDEQARPPDHQQWQCLACDPPRTWDTQRTDVTQRHWNDHDFGEACRTTWNSALIKIAARRPAVGCGTALLVNNRLSRDSTVLIHHDLWGAVAVTVVDILQPQGYHVALTGHACWAVSEAVAVAGAARAAALQLDKRIGTRWKLQDDTIAIVVGMERSGRLVIDHADTTRCYPANYLIDQVAVLQPADTIEHVTAESFPSISTREDGTWRMGRIAGSQCFHQMRRTRHGEARAILRAFGQTVQCDSCKLPLKQDTDHWQCDTAQRATPCALTICIPCAARQRSDRHEHRDMTEVKMVALTMRNKEGVAAWQVDEMLSTLMPEQSLTMATALRDAGIGGAGSEKDDHSFLRQTLFMIERRWRQEALAALGGKLDTLLGQGGTQGVDRAMNSRIMKELLTVHTDVMTPSLWSRGWVAIVTQAATTMGECFGGAMGALHTLEVEVNDVPLGMANPTLRFLEQRLAHPKTMPVAILHTRATWDKWMTHIRATRTRARLPIYWNERSRPEWWVSAEDNIFHAIGALSPEGQTAVRTVQDWQVVGTRRGELGIRLSSSKSFTGNDTPLANRMRRRQRGRQKRGWQSAQEGLAALLGAEGDKQTACCVRLRELVTTPISSGTATARWVHEFQIQPVDHKPDTDCPCWTCTEEKIRLVRGEQRLAATAPSGGGNQRKGTLTLGEDLNTACNECRALTDTAENPMLLCDGCPNGTHLQCLTPRLHTVPDGDWLCARCVGGTRSPANQLVAATALRFLNTHTLASSQPWHEVAEVVTWFNPEVIIQPGHDLHTGGTRSQKVKTGGRNSFFGGAGKADTNGQTEGTERSGSSVHPRPTAWKGEVHLTLPDPSTGHRQAWGRLALAAASEAKAAYVQLPSQAVASTEVIIPRAEPPFVPVVHRNTSPVLPLVGREIRVHFGSHPPRHLWSESHLTVQLLEEPPHGTVLRQVDLANGHWCIGDLNSPTALIRSDGAGSIRAHAGPLTVWLPRDARSLGQGMALLEKILDGGRGEPLPCAELSHGATTPHWAAPSLVRGHGRRHTGHRCSLTLARDGGADCARVSL